jgi:subtilisin-like proprotein convertase family protein
VRTVAAAIPDNNATGATSTYVMPDNLIVEQVEVVFNATHTYRGDLQVVLTSPSGTQSTLAERHNDSNNNYTDWRFRSVRHWGETSAGNWSLQVADKIAPDVGTFDSWRLIVHGRQPVFADAGLSHSLWRGIEAVHLAGITSGCAAGYFCPENSVTRAQMAIFLERGVRGASFAPACSGTVFDDVTAATSGCGWIEQFAADGITSGCATGRYCPSAMVSRAQMAIFLLRAKHGAAYTPPACSGTLFTDVRLTHSACAWIEQLANEDITSGCAANLFCPANPVSRSQMASFLTRTFGLVEP